MGPPTGPRDLVSQNSEKLCRAPVFGDGREVRHAEPSEEHPFRDTVGLQMGARTRRVASSLGNSGASQATAVGAGL